MAYKLIKPTLIITIFLTAGIFLYAFSNGYKKVELALTTLEPSENPVVQQKEEAIPATMLFVGDMMLSRSVGERTEKSGDWRYPFLKIGDTLRSADFTFGNLEGPVSDKGKGTGGMMSFRANPKMMEGLTYSGFDMVTIANNHIWDYGKEAFLDTLSLLKTAGIDYVGGGKNFEEARKALIKNINGTRVAFLGYTHLLPPGTGRPSSEPASALIDETQMKQDIVKARETADLVVVTFHWGEEYNTKHNATQEKTGKLAIDFGASLVIGHHPHVAQEIEKYKDGYIAYSLGNFIFDQTFSAETMKGLMLRVTLRDKKIEKVEPVEIAISRGFQASVTNEKGR